MQRVYKIQFPLNSAHNKNHFANAACRNNRRFFTESYEGRLQPT